MKKLILVASLALVGFAAAAPAQAQWRRGRDRVTVIEQPPLINNGTLAAILAIQLARKAAEREKETTVIRDRSREFVPLK
jgi:hypothetical protein